jgi:N-acetylglucosaminyl-diphospho-decaprenol L-rhamnosyltransferase
MLLSYCVVNTGGRDFVMACLEAIERTHPPGVEHEVLVLDNASGDGSAEAVRERWPEARLFALELRLGKAENDSTLLRAARGRYALLLNEDSELREGAARALIDALEADPGAAVAGAQLLTSAGDETACAWRLPDAGWALAAVVFMQDRFAVQSGGDRVHEVGWTQSSAMLVRRAAAEQVGFLDPDFFVYSDETDFCRRLHDAGWRILFVPAARAVHHNQLGTDAESMRRRIVEFHRGRDRYFRKHGMRGTRLLWKACWTWAYLARAAAALVLPGSDPRRYVLHARQQVLPASGEGIREAAAAYNRAREEGAPVHGGAAEGAAPTHDRAGDGATP